MSNDAYGWFHRRSSAWSLFQLKAYVSVGSGGSTSEKQPTRHQRLLSSSSGCSYSRGGLHHRNREHCLGFPEYDNAENITGHEENWIFHLPRSGLRICQFFYCIIETIVMIPFSIWAAWPQVFGSLKQVDENICVWLLRSWLWIISPPFQLLSLSEWSCKWNGRSAADGRVQQLRLVAVHDLFWTIETDEKCSDVWFVPFGLKYVTD